MQSGRSMIIWLYLHLLYSLAVQKALGLYVTWSWEEKKATISHQCGCMLATNVGDAVLVLRLEMLLESLMLEISGCSIELTCKKN